MFAYYREIQPPTAVSEAIPAKLTESDQKHLIVVRATNIDVYEVREKRSGRYISSTGPPAPPLHLKSTHAAHGLIHGVRAVRMPGTQHDLLVVSCLQGKCSVLEYDPYELDFKIISMHYFEDDSLRHGKVASAALPDVEVDPQSRCAVLNLYDLELAVLPFRQENAMLMEEDMYEDNQDDGEDGIAGEGSMARGNYPVLPTYRINLAELGVRRVRSMKFLQGYFEPTLMILYEHEPTWSGRVAARMDTCALLTISIAVEERSSPIIWSQKHLPYSCFRILPVPEPIGGALVFSPDMVLYFNQSSNCVGKKMSSYADEVISPQLHVPFARAPVTPLSLENCTAVGLTPEYTLVSLATGDLYLLQLVTEGRRVGNIFIERVGVSVITSSICRVSEKLFFFASRVGSSLLLHVERTLDKGDEKEKALPATAVLEAIEESAKKKKKKRKLEELEEIDDEDEELNIYGGKIKVTTQEEDEVAAEEAVGQDVDGALVKEIAQPAKMKDASRYGEDEGVEQAVAAEEGLSLMEVLPYSAQKTPEEEEKEKGIFSFTVIDSLSNLGPLRDISLGLSQDVASISLSTSAAKKSHQVSQLVDVIGSSGHGKSGSFSVVQSTVRPFPLAEFAMNGIEGVWCLYSNTRVTKSKTRKRKRARTSTVGRDGPGEEETQQGSNLHQLMIISKSSTTMIFAAGSDLQEISKSTEYAIDSCTVGAGNVGNNDYVIQVIPKKVLIMTGTKRVETYTVNEELHIRSCSIADPFVLLHLSDSSVRLLHFHAKGNSVSAVEVSESAAPSRLFTEVNISNSLQGTTASAVSLSKQHPKCRPYFEDSAFVMHPAGEDVFNAVDVLDAANDEDEESVLLYGRGARNIVPPAHQSSEEDVAMGELEEMERDEEQHNLLAEATVLETGMIEGVRDGLAGVVEHTEGLGGEQTKPGEEQGKKGKLGGSSDVFMLVASSTGALTVLQLPSCTVVFEAAGICLGLKTLSNALFHSSTVGEVEKEDGPAVSVSDVSLRVVGHVDRPQPTLFITLNSGDFYMYRGEWCPIFGKDMSYSFRFLKVDSTFRSFVDERRDRNTAEDNASPSVKLCRSRVVSFIHAGWYGIYLCGPQSAFCFAERGNIRLFPMTQTDAAVGPACFSEFRNNVCPNGFVYIHDKTTLKIVQMSAEASHRITYSHSLPVTTISLLPSTSAAPTVANKLVYIPQFQIYAAIVVQYVSVAPTIGIVDPDNEEADESELEHDLTAPAVLEPKFEIRLISPKTWEILDRFPLDTREHATCMDLVWLHTSEKVRKCRPVLAVGTITNNGEDSQAKGRVILFEIIKQSMSENEEEKPNLKLTLSKIQKQGPVTALCGLQGSLVLALGPKVLVYFVDFERKDLKGLAFFDAKLYVVTLTSIKDYLLLGDIYKGSFFIRWLESQKTLALLGKDYNTVHVTAVQFFLHEKKLSFVSCDEHKNLHLLTYAPFDVESRGGEMLLTRSQFYLGSNVAKVLRVPVNASPATREFSHLLLFGTLDGGIGSLAPVSEQAFRRLAMVGHKMVTGLQHFAGLNPKAFRHYKSIYRLPTRQTSRDTVIDGRLVEQYLQLDVLTQHKIAGEVGMKRETVIQAIEQAQSMSKVF